MIGVLGTLSRKRQKRALPRLRAPGAAAPPSHQKGCLYTLHTARLAGLKQDAPFLFALLAEEKEGDAGKPFKGVVTRHSSALWSHDDVCRYTDPAHV